MNQQFDISAAAQRVTRSASALPMTNRQIVFLSRPKEMPEESNFAYEVTAAPSPPARDEVLVRALFLSMDPYLRGKMRENSPFGSFELDKPMQSAAVAEVVQSRSPLFEPKDKVAGFLEWADYCVVSAKSLRRLNPKSAPISTALSVLGMTGLTAYFGMTEIAHPKKGETVVVSAAAGSVGSVAGQIAKLHGCKVVGLVGSDAKAAFIKRELGFDAAINYKTADIALAFRQTCPDGVDIYYDNVGGTITDAVLARIRNNARIVICGQISTYNQDKPDLGPRPYGLILSHSAFMKGFSVYDYEKQHPRALQQLARWVKDGKIKYRENIVDGLENAPKAFIGLFKGENIGKQLVRVATPS